MPAMQFHMERLTEQLKHEISLAIAQEMRDPRIPPVVTVTRVKLAHDTRNATVFISILGDDATQQVALETLNKGAPFLQHVVSQRITMKHFPRLGFKLDKSLEQGQRINDLLKDVQNDLE